MNGATTPTYTVEGRRTAATARAVALAGDPDRALELAAKTCPLLGDLRPDLNPAVPR